MYRVRPGIETEEAEIHPNLLPKVPADVVEWLVPQPIGLVEAVAHRAEPRPVLFELLPERAMLAEVMQEHAIGEELVNLEPRTVLARTRIPDLPHYVIHHLDLGLGSEGEAALWDPVTRGPEVAIKSLLVFGDFGGAAVRVGSLPRKLRTRLRAGPYALEIQGRWVCAMPFKVDARAS